MNSVSFSDLRLLQLSVDNVGPFRSGRETIKFDGDLAPDGSGRSRGTAPSTIFMLLAQNGHGKTTLLECIYALMSLLGGVSAAPLQSIGYLGPSVRAQLDLRTTWTVDARTQTVLLSIWMGGPEPILLWTDDEVENIAQASAWARIGFEWTIGGTAEIAVGSDTLGRLLLQSTRAALGVPPSALYGESSDLPCVLFFPANRAIFAPSGDRFVARPNGWGYQPALRFETDGPAWGTSVDNLLVWLEWLDDGRLKALLEYLNMHIFADSGKTIQPPRREDLTTEVYTRAGSHPLNMLSHGERALLQFYTRALSHMTRNTIILIDEVEIHLHTRLMNRFFQTLKSLLRNVPSLSIVFTTHNRELIKVFDHSRPEEGLVKGGFLIEEGLS